MVVPLAKAEVSVSSSSLTAEGDGKSLSWLGPVGGGRVVIAGVVLMGRHRRWGRGGRKSGVLPSTTLGVMALRVRALELSGACTTQGQIVIMMKSGA